MRGSIAFGFGFSAFALLGAADAPRVPGSPYPTAAIPDTVFVIDDGSFTEGQRLIVETLQGGLREGSALYRKRSGGYALWLEEMGRAGGPLIRTEYQRDFPGLLAHFRSRLRGYVLCDLHSHSSNAAITLCGGLRTASGAVIAATPEDSLRLAALSLPLLGDARGRDEAWARAQAGSLSDRIVVLQDPAKDLLLADYSVFAGALHFYAPTAADPFKAALARMRGPAALLGWGDDEFTLVGNASRASVMVHAADFAVNLSTLSRFPMTAKQAPAPQAAPTPAGTHTVCFLMSDGDNLQWTLGAFAKPGGNWYGHPQRGSIPMGWTIAPALAELAPAALARLYRNASSAPAARDVFVAAPSGAGYLFPEAFAGLDSAAALTARLMAKADLRILNILGNDPSDAYLDPFLRRDGIDAVFFYPFSDYSGLKGSVRFLRGKPVIGGFANLWDGFETPESLAAKLNARPKDPKSAAGYSLIPVHAWSRTLADVAACARSLGPGVRVVPPDEFARSIAQSLGPGAAGVARSRSRRPASGPRLARSGRAFQADGKRLARGFSATRPGGR